MAPTAPTPPKPGPRGMSGPERVAAILLTMGKPQAARLMKHFEPAEIKLITRSVAELKLKMRHSPRKTRPMVKN